jgi:hypothetical protein
MYKNYILMASSRLFEKKQVPKKTWTLSAFLNIACELRPLWHKGKKNLSMYLFWWRGSFLKIFPGGKVPFM